MSTNIHLRTRDLANVSGLVDRLVLGSRIAWLRQSPTICTVETAQVVVRSWASSGHMAPLS